LQLEEMQVTQRAQFYFLFNVTLFSLQPVESRLP